MGRFTDRDEIERFAEEYPQSPMPLSQGRAGGSGSSNTDHERRGKEQVGSGRAGSAAAREHLTSLIDDAASGQVTMTEFLERLKERGVAALPSVQTSGRLNGIVYRFRGETIKGSSLGRDYTAHGLQQSKGVRYDAVRDRDALVRALETAGLHRTEAPSIERNRDQNRTGDRATRVREHETGLSPDQKATLAEIGTFRTVDVDDLARYRYAGNSARSQQDLRQLAARGLVQRRTVQYRSTGSRQAVVVLTRTGQNLANRIAKQSSGQTEQRYYAGLVKPSEVRHDTGIYRMYQAESERIRRQGGTVKRIVLDYELKRKMFSDLNKEKDASALRYASRKEEIADQNGLTVVNAHVVFPDVRIEYETRDHQPEKVDLELASDHYSNSQVAAKRAAGLKIYGPDSAPRSPALQDPEIVAGLISM